MINVISKLGNRWKSMLLVLTIIGSISGIGVFFEEGASATRVVTFKGIFSEPATDWPLTQIFIGHIYGFLYSITNVVPWYGIIDYSLALCGFLLLFRAVSKASSPLVIAGFFLLGIDDLVMFSFTRTAMLVVSGGLLSLYLLQNGKNRAVQIAGLVVLIVVGFCDRPQAFAYITALFGLFILTDLIITRQWKAALPGLKLVAIPVFICTILMGIYLTTMPPDIKESQRLAPRFYNLFGGGFYDDISTLSKGDSLAILLLKGNFVNDRKVFNEEFTDRVTRNTPRQYFSVSKFLSPKLLQRSAIKYGDFYYRHHIPDLVVLFSILIWLLVVWIRKRDARLLWIAGFLSFCLLSLLFITLIVKMELRISSPLFLFTYVAVWILLNRIHFELRTGRWMTAMLMLPISAGLIYNCMKLNAASQKYHRFVAENLKITSAINTHFENHTVVVSNPGIRMFSRLPFNEFKETGTNVYKSYEGEAIIYMPTMQQMVRDFAGSLEMEDFFDAMFEQKDNVVYLANDEWVNLMTAYLEHHYGIRYEFQRLDIDALNIPGTSKPVALYRPKSRTVIREN